MSRTSQHQSSDADSWEGNNSSVDLVLRRDDRAVAISIEHAVGLLVLVILAAAFIQGMTDIHDTREEATTNQELRRIADAVAEGLVTVDSLVVRGNRHDSVAGRDTTRALTQVDLPPYIGGATYSVSINATGHILVTSNGETVHRDVDLATPVKATGVGGGDVTIVYNPSTNELEVVQK